MNEPLLETSRFVLRPLVLADVTPEYLGWLHDVRTNEFIETAEATGDLEALRSYVGQRIGRPEVAFLGIFAKVSGLHIGNIKFEPLDRRGGFATMGMLIGNREWRGKGAAAEVLEACARWLYERYGIARIHLGVDSANTAAYRAYLKAGFRVARSRNQATGSAGIQMVRLWSRSHRLALGTVQFGQAYGIANQAGMIDSGAIAPILTCAWKAGVGTLDTAVSYGASEQRLGETGIGQWQVVSKVPALPHGSDDVVGWLEGAVLGSLERLRIPRFRGLLLHRPAELLGAKGGALCAALVALKDRGLVEKIGVSVYGPEELEALNLVFPYDMVQAPFSVVDRRLDESGWLATLSNQGVEIHVRSVFLQGLLLMESGRLPEAFSQWHALWGRWHDWLDEQSVTPLQACLSFALSEPRIDRVVVGVDNLRQLEAILAEADAVVPPPPADLRSGDLDLINPSRWSVS